MRGWLLVALAAEAVLVLVDVLTGSEHILTTTYVLVPFALAIRGRPRDVALLAALAGALAFASGAWNDFFASEDHLIRLTVVLTGGALAVLSARARFAAAGSRRETDVARGEREDARRDAEAARGRLDAMLGALAEAVTVQDRSGEMVYANQAAARLLGAASPEEAVATSSDELAGRFIITKEDGSAVQLEDLPGHQALKQGAAEPLLTRSVERASGREYWLLTKATVVHEGGETLVVNIIEDVTEAKDAELRQRFLAEAGQALAGSLDYEETLERIARLVVPGLADWCAVDLLDPRGELQRVALAHLDPEKVAFANELSERYPPDLEVEAGLGNVLRAGVSELYPDIPDELLEAGAVDAEHLELIRRIGMRSAMIVPMRVGEGTIGAMTFVTAESSRAFDEADLAFAEDLAQRCAAAVESARLYAERTVAAQTLQRSLLPERLPELDAWSAASAYRAGDDTSEVGGDFFDVFALRDSLMVVLGDVTGKGVKAAALTALVRHTAKTAARFDSSPSAVLALVDEVLREQPDPAYVTVVCAFLRERADRALVTLASGGHPLPLHIDAAGAVRPLGRPGVLLGAVDSGEWPETEAELAVGDTLLFYTDGVTDTPGTEQRFGEERLMAFAAAGASGPEELVGRLDAALEAYAHGMVGDDRALLALQYRGASVREEPSPAPAYTSR